MTIYAPEMLRKALEVALEAELGGKSLVEFYGAAAGVPTQSVPLHLGKPGPATTGRPSAERRSRAAA